MFARRSPCTAPGALEVEGPLWKPRPYLRLSGLWGGGCVGLRPRPVLPGRAWPFKPDRARPQVVDARGGGGAVTWAADGATRGSGRWWPPALATAAPSPRPCRRQVYCRQVRPRQVRPHWAPSAACSRDLAATLARPLPLMIGARAALSCASLPDHCSRPRVCTLGQFAPHSQRCPQPATQSGSGASRSLGGTHSSPLPQVALDAPGWGRI